MSDIAVLDAPSTPGIEATRQLGSSDRFRVLRAELLQPGLILAAAVILTALAWAFLPQLFTARDPLAVDQSASFAPPGIEHPFGTDQLGRDIFARTVHGTSTTLSATLLAVVIAFVIGTALGLIAGFLRGVADLVAMRFIDVLLSVPTLLLAMVVVTGLGYGTLQVAFAVGIASVASFARVMRSEVLVAAQTDYVEAGQSLGLGKVQLLLRHVLPNSLTSVVSLVPLEFGQAILAIAGLGFLGFGAPPPQPEWGLLVSEGRSFLGSHPWLSILPGLVIVAVVVSSNRISQSVERIFEHA